MVCELELGAYVLLTHDRVTSLCLARATIQGRRRYLKRSRAVCERSAWQPHADAVDLLGSLTQLPCPLGAHAQSIGSLVYLRIIL